MQILNIFIFIFQPLCLCLWYIWNICQFLYISMLSLQVSRLNSKNYNFENVEIELLSSIFPGWYYRRQFLQKRRAAIVIQKCWRSYRAKKSYLVIKRGYYRLQALIRSRVLTSKLQQVRGMIVRLQARCRGFYVRRFQQRERWAVVFLQRQVRAWIGRKRERRLRVTITLTPACWASSARV